MLPNVSLISDAGDITIEGGSFTLNVQQTTTTNRLGQHDLKKFCALLDSANAKQTGDLGHVVESRMQKFSKNLEDHQDAVSSVVRQLQSGPFPIDGSMLQDTTHALLSRVQQLAKLLPAAHRELAQQFAGTLRPHTTTRSRGDNLVLVIAPLLSSSIFSTFPAEVQFMVFYFLAAMIFVDLYHPRLIHNRPSSRVNVLDALGKYHDFPWSACAHPMTFHAEFLRRFLNQTGFPFVKSRLYEVEYNGCLMKPDDWASVKPFTDLFVNFVLIQQGGQSRVVRCPWCRRENPLPSVSGSEESTTNCSCSECGRDFSAAVGPVEDGGGQLTPPPGLCNTISLEIRRFRIRLQSLHQGAPLPSAIRPHKTQRTSGTFASSLLAFSASDININMLPAVPRSWNPNSSHYRTYSSSSAATAPPSRKNGKFGTGGTANLFVFARRAEKSRQSLGLERRKPGQIIFTSGETQTHPGVKCCVQPDQPRIPVEFSELYICSGGVNLLPLLVATRAALLDRAKSDMGANTLTDEQWECIITGPKPHSGRIYKVQLRYMACATKSCAMNPRHPVRIDRATGIPGLMTILKRCDTN